jgi:hypothetical protein
VELVNGESGTEWSCVTKYRDSVMIQKDSPVMENRALESKEPEAYL